MSRRSIWHKQAAALPNVFVIHVFLCEISKKFAGVGGIRPFVRMCQDQLQPAFENEDIKDNF